MLRLALMPATTTTTTTATALATATGLTNDRVNLLQAVLACLHGVLCDRRGLSKDTGDMIRGGDREGDGEEGCCQREDGEEKKREPHFSEGCVTRSERAWRREFGGILQ